MASYEADFAYALDSTVTCDFDGVKDMISNPDVQIIECRPPPAVQNTGTLEGAIMIPAPVYLGEDGATKSSEQIAALFTDKGVDPSKPMVFTCGAGIMATMGYACAMKAKFEGPFYVYDGSWSEFSKRSQETQ